MVAARNLVVYMADGVRWDAHPPAVANRGTTFKTVASSLHTPTAIASMLTGRYLPNHGIRGFTDVLEDRQWTILDAFPNGGLSATPGNFNNEVYGNLLRRYDQTPLSEIEEPFCWFMRDAGGHAPYDEFDADLQTEESVRSYLERHAGDPDRMRQDYEAAIQSSLDRFRRHVLEPLADRGLREETLVLFISDHGQMLGEYGHVGESYPACPEVAYVPATFIHPDLPVEQRDELFRHVDLPAAVDYLVDGEIDTGPTDGEAVFADGVSPSFGLNFYDRPYPSFAGEFTYRIDSLWERNGGHAFVKSSVWDRVKLTAGFLTRIPAGIQLRRSRNLEGLRYLVAAQYSWGKPSLSADDAGAELDRYEYSDVPDPDLDLSAETRGNLEDLGYL